MPLLPFSICLLIVLAFSALSIAEQRQTPSVKEQRTLEELLDQKLDFDFRRTALQDVVAELSKKSKIAISIDGESLKAEGFTRNMSQTFALKNATVREALLVLLEGNGNRAIADSPQKLIVLYDEKTHGFMLTTSSFAKRQMREAYPLKQKKTE